jgi:threonine dehydrogenase-like Zn-dependent dehydrogenase
MGTKLWRQRQVTVPMDLVVVKECSIVGTVGMHAPRFEAMLRMVEAGKLAPGKLVNRTIPLEEASAVVASMDDFATLGVTVIDRY